MRKTGMWSATHLKFEIMALTHYVPWIQKFNCSRISYCECSTTLVKLPVFVDTEIHKFTLTLLTNTSILRYQRYANIWSYKNYVLNHAISWENETVMKIWDQILLLCSAEDEWMVSFKLALETALWYSHNS